MKRILCVSSTLILLIGFSYSKVGKINVAGSLEVQGRSLNNSTDLANYDSSKVASTDDKIGDVTTRVLLGLETNLSEDVAAKVLIRKNDRTYGSGVQSIFGSQFVLNVENAYLKLDKFLKIFKVIIGRQFLGKRGDLNLYFGPNSGDALGVQAVDGLKADTRIGKFDVSILSFKLAESGLIPSQDIDLSGVIVGCGGRIIKGLKTELYAYQQIDRTLGAGGQKTRDDLRIYGIKANAKIKKLKGLNAKLEFATNHGKNNNTNLSYEGVALILGVGYNRLKIRNVPLKFGLEVASGSGDDDATDTKNHNFTSINSDLRYGTIWANSLGNVGLANTTILKGYAMVSRLLDRRLSAVLSYYSISRTKTTTGQSSDWGNEIDLKFKWEQSKNVSLELILAQLSPGKALQNNLGVTTSDSMTKILTNLKVLF